jgi:uncharacterized protein YggU (UPF0235/DUF167 family)
MRDDQSSATVMVQAHPRSRRERLAFVGDVLHVWVTAPPVDGAANEAIGRLVAHAAGVPRSHVTIDRGFTGRHKRLTIAGITADELRARIAALTGDDSAAR